jgi:hypothetical protein
VGHPADPSASWRRPEAPPHGAVPRDGEGRGAQASPAQPRAGRSRRPESTVGSAKARPGVRAAEVGLRAGGHWDKSGAALRRAPKLSRSGGGAGSGVSLGLACFGPRSRRHHGDRSPWLLEFHYPGAPRKGTWHPDSLARRATRPGHRRAGQGLGGDPFLLARAARLSQGFSPRQPRSGQL